MLFTLSQADYNLAELNSLINPTQNYIIVLWQNAVLLPLKYPDFFQDKNSVALAQDITARGLSNYPMKTIELSEFIKLTEQFTPHIAL